MERTVRWMRRRAITLFCWIAFTLLAPAPLVSPAAAEEVRPLVLSGEPDAHGSLTAAMWMLPDPAGTLTLADIQSPDGARAFLPIPDGFNGGYLTRGGSWVRVVLSAATQDAAGAWWLKLDAPFVDTMEIYTPVVEPDGTVRYDRQEAGAFHVAGHPGNLGQLALVSVGIPAGRALPVYVRIAGNRSLSLDMSAWRAIPLFKHMARLGLLRGGIIGTLLLTAVASLLFGVRLRDRNLLLYSAYIAITGFYFLCNGGYLNLLFPAISPQSYIRLLGVTVFSSSLLGAIFILSIYRMPETFPLLRWPFLIIVGIAIAGVLASAADYYPAIAPVNTIAGLALAALAPVVAWRAMRRGDLASQILFVGFAIYGLPLCVVGARLLGLLPVTLFTEWGFPLLACAHALTILAGIVERARTTEKQLAHLNIELLRSAREEGQRLEAAVEHRTLKLQTEIVSRRAAEEATLTVLREQRNLLAMVSHEFRSPIGVIMASLALLRHHLPEAIGDTKQALHNIARATHRLKALVATCLADEWLERAAMRFQPHTLSLGDLVEQVAAERGRASGRTISVEVDGRVSVRADPVLLSMALDNLLSNAVSYSPEDMPVDVRVSQSEGHALVAVHDYGSGVAPGEQNQIFERYFRGANARSISGVGLGLHIVRVIVSLHEANVRVHMDPVEGTIFTLHLQAIESEEAIGRKRGQDHEHD